MHVGLSTGFANHSEIESGRFVREEMQQILRAEELGFESIWITEHHFSDYSVAPSPLQYLSYIAGRTQKMRLGTSVVVVPWHDPIRIAEEIAVLDQLSDGRALIGFGRGLGRMEYEGFGVEQADAREIFDEAVPAILKALETGVIEASGEHVKIPRRELRPAPYRPLTGRAFIAAGTDASMMAGARMGLGRLYLGQPNVSEAARAAKEKEAAESQAFSPFAPGVRPEEEAKARPAPNGTYAPGGPWDTAWREHHPDVPPTAPFVLNLVVVDESRDRAEEMARHYSAINFKWVAKNYSLTESFAGLKGYEQYTHLNMTQEHIDAAAKHAHKTTIFGTPQDILEQMERSLVDLRPQGFAPTLWMGGMPHDDAMQALDLFARKCLPELRTWKGAEMTINHGNEQLALAD